MSSPSATLNGVDLAVIGDFAQQLASARGEIYHYDFIDPKTRRMLGVSVYEFPPGMERISRRTFAERASADRRRADAVASRARLDARVPDDRGRRGRSTRSRRPTGRSTPCPTFVTEPPDARFMGYRQLREYTERLRAAVSTCWIRTSRWPPSSPSRS